MTWLIPLALGAAAAAAIGVTLLHLLARDRPPRWMLPTARFVAPGTARATRRARTPRDLLLLAVRVLALLLAGAAFAAPVLHPEGGTVARVLVLDLGDARRRAAAIDTARVRQQDGDRLVVVDTAVRIVRPGAERATLDSLASSAAAPGSVEPPPSPASTRPTLTAALIAAVRAAALLPQQADSASLVMIAPSGAHDAALSRARPTWPGRATVLDAARRAGADTLSSAAEAQRPVVRGVAGDAVVAAARLAGATLARAGATSGASRTLVVRGAATPGDSAWAAAGGTLLVWTADTAAAGLAPLPQTDTTGGLVADGYAALFSAVRTYAPPPGVAVARWIDGEPAVTEAAHGLGCIRTAAITVPTAGDITLRPAFQQVLRTLMRPCSRAHAAPIADSTRALLAGDGPFARAGALRASSSRSPATPWLLGAALALLLLAEPLLRRRRGAPDAGAAA